MKIKTLVASLALGFGVVATVQATPSPYAAVGTPNAASYTFTATSTGDIIAFFTGAFTVGFHSTVQLLVNGNPKGGYVLDNLTTAIGTAFNLGSVVAGDKIGFQLNVVDNVTGADSVVLNSDKALNANGQQQIYSNDYVSTGDGIPSGTYVGWEDLRFNSATHKSDYDYNDNTYVFTNVSDLGPTVPVPVPATPLLLSLGLGVMALIRRRKQA